ncbi:MAG: hypothetical protein WBB25_01730 [Sulfitobacter sp.]
MADAENTRSDHTTTTTTTTPGGAGMGFVLGAVVIVVAGLAYFMFADSDTGGAPDEVNVTVEGAGDAVQDAGEAVEGAAEQATTPTE